MSDEELTDEPWPDDPHQSPHPDSEEWNDPEWRNRWLLGLTDEELGTLTASEKGRYLPAYVYRPPYEKYGQTAADHILGSFILQEAGLYEKIDNQPYVLTKLGAAVRHYVHHQYAHSLKG